MKDRALMEKIVSILKAESGIILLHNNADIDAVGSAIALQSAFPEFSIGAFQKTSHVSRIFLENFPEIEIDLSPELDKYNTILILDTSTPSQLGANIDPKNRLIVIDHHLYNDQWDDALYYCDDTKSSCAEIVFEMLTFIEHNFSPKIILVILASILADTGQFKYANLNSLLTVTELLKLGDVRLSDAFKLLVGNGTEDTSKRIAHLKGAQRLKIRQYHGFIVGVSQLSSNEASMCKHILMLGADVAFVGAQRDQQFRISGRASGKIVEKGLHLGEFFQSLGSELACDGGGHAGAAGLNGIGDVEMMLNLCMKKLESELPNLEM